MKWPFAKRQQPTVIVRQEIIFFRPLTSSMVRMPWPAGVDLDALEENQVALDVLGGDWISAGMVTIRETKQ